MNKNDLRYVKTEKLLRENYIELVKEKAGKPIKLIELCDKCLINKATFYQHYETLPDFQNKFKEQILREIFDDVPEIEKLLEDPETVVPNIIRAIAKHGSIFNIAFAYDPITIQVATIEHVLLNMFLKDGKNTNEINPILFCIGGAANILTRSLNQKDILDTVRLIKKTLKN